MAKIYKAEVYFIDHDDEYDDSEHFQEELKRSMWTLEGLAEVTNVEESESFTWFDELRINSVAATKEDFEKYFK